MFLNDWYQYNAKSWTVHILRKSSNILEVNSFLVREPKQKAEKRGSSVYSEYRPLQQHMIPALGIFYIVKTFGKAYDSTSIDIDTFALPTYYGSQAWLYLQTSVMNVSHVDINTYSLQGRNILCVLLFDFTLGLAFLLWIYLFSAESSTILVHPF